MGLRKIKFLPGVALVVGSIIGSGLFMKPASMAAQLGSPELLILVWALAGIFTLMGALVFAELGAMLPQTGGIYAFFRHVFGDFWAFLYGWAAFAVINTAAVAAIAFVCAGYADHFLHLPEFNAAIVQKWRWDIPFIGTLYPLDHIGVKLLAVFIVLLLSWLNARSLAAGNAFQFFSTLLKVLVIGALILGIFFSGNGDLQNCRSDSIIIQNENWLGGLVLAMTGAFYAYDGWGNITFVAGEIHEPRRNIPRMLLAGVLICMAIYMLVNLAYLYVLPIDAMADSELVARDAAARAWGNTSGDIIAAMIVLCTLGAVNGNILACSRVSFAMGRDSLFPAAIGREHPKSGTPRNALWLHAIWTCGFILTGSFDMLADMFVFITWIAYGMGAVALFILRKREPQHPRPYRVWGYPLVPILFLGFTLFYFVSTLISDTQNYLAGRQPVVNSLLGMLITALGIPLFYLFRKRKNQEPAN
jgi:APA family basic amino acid/polyamine antiporter